MQENTDKNNKESIPKKATFNIIILTVIVLFLSLLFTFYHYSHFKERRISKYIDTGNMAAFYDKYKQVNFEKSFNQRVNTTTDLEDCYITASIKKVLQEGSIDLTSDKPLERHSLSRFYFTCHNEEGHPDKYLHYLRLESPEFEHLINETEINIVHSITYDSTFINKGSISHYSKSDIELILNHKEIDSIFEQMSAHVKILKEKKKEIRDNISSWNN